MERTLFSTRDLASMLDVNVSTVKRWADSGQLACIKTPGGHRRFRANDVQIFLKDRGIHVESLPDLPTRAGSSGLETAVRERDWGWLRDQLASSAIAGDTHAIVNMFNAMYASGIHPAVKCDVVIAGALETIGDAWYDREISVADEHLATHAIRYALNEMSARWLPLRQTPYTALCACPSQELHEMACECVRRVLQHEGWNVVMLGANTPTDAIVDAIVHHQPHLVALSATMPPDVPVFSTDVARIVEAASEMGGEVIIGGQAIDGTVRRSLPRKIRLISDMDLLVDYVLESFPSSKT